MNSGIHAACHLRPSIILVLILVLTAGLVVLAGPPARAGALSGALQPYAASPAWAQRPLVVEVWLSDPGAATRLAAAGAQVQFQAGNRLQCRVRGADLAALGELPGVASVTLPALVVSSRLPARIAPRPLTVRPQFIYGFGTVVSEGVRLTNAAAFQAIDIGGAGATIAVIAEGFGGAADAEIPAVNMVSFRSDGTMGTSQLGTATAEVVADMAPLAAQTLIAVDTALSLRQAANYVAANRFTAAVCTVGLVDGPFDATDPVSQALSAVASAGVLWVQSAGDLAQRHWQGQYADSDSNGFCDFAGGNGISLNLPAGQFQAYLSWYESAGALTAQDYDLAIYQGSGPGATLVAQSSVTQNGSTPPAESLIADLPAAGVYELRIKAVKVDLSKPDRFQLYTPQVDLPASVVVTATSLPAPATSPLAFTVGATAGTVPPPPPALAVDEIEPYSGRGPTVTGLLKPDLVGPDCVSTSLAAYTPFFSTAAAAAHMAGAAGLLYSEDPGRGPAEFRRLFLQLAVPLPDASQSPNNNYGNGRLNLRVGLDTEPPSVTILYPQNSTTISTRTPVIRARITDNNNEVDPSSIVLRIDGTAVTGFIYDTTSGLLTYLVSTPLTLNSHQVTLDASDRSGNAADTAVVNFRVALPMLDAGIHLFSLPYTFEAVQLPTPNELFGLAEGVRMARWWPGDSQYHLYPDAYATFSPPDAVPPDAVVPNPPAGLGFFVSLPSAATMNITGLPIAGAAPYEIRLTVGSRAPKGWNMIGCPFLSPVDFGSVQFVTDGVRQSLTEAVAARVTDGVLFAFRSTAAGGFYTFPADPFSAVMEPFQGYWLRVFKDTTMLIYPPAVAMQAPAATHPAASGEGWRLQLVASADGKVDPCTFVGMNPKATAQYSQYWAIGEPPAVDGGLRAALVENNWGEHSGYYAQIIKPASGRQEWELEIACETPNTQVALRWPSLNATVPAGVSLMLQDLDTGEEVYMRTSTGYSFKTGPQGGVRRLRVIASLEPVTSLTLSGVTAQAMAGGAVAFTYALSQAAEVTAEIRNISGALIKRFAAQPSRGGTVELLVWNGRSDRGSKVPAGRYLVRLTARTDKGQTVQAIRPFEIIP